MAKYALLIALPEYSSNLPQSWESVFSSNYLKSAGQDVQAELLQVRRGIKSYIESDDTEYPTIQWSTEWTQYLTVTRKNLILSSPKIDHA